MKAAFTRAYNKESHLTPYSLQAVKKGKRGAPEADLTAMDGEQDSQQPEEDEEEPGADAMIKVLDGVPCQCVLLLSSFQGFVWVFSHLRHLHFPLAKEGQASEEGKSRRFRKR